MKNMNGKGKSHKVQASAGNLASDGFAHYFGIELIPNPDGTVLVKWSMLNEFPAGWILKDFGLNKHDASWDEQTALSAQTTWLGSPYGLGPSNFEDIRTWDAWTWEFVDPFPNPPGTAIKYNIVGSAGLPAQFMGDVSSEFPVGSEVLIATF